MNSEIKSGMLCVYLPTGEEVTAQKYIGQPAPIFKVTGASFIVLRFAPDCWIIDKPVGEGADKEIEEWFPEWVLHCVRSKNLMPLKDDDQFIHEENPYTQTQPLLPQRETTE